MPVPGSPSELVADKATTCKSLKSSGGEAKEDVPPEKPSKKRKAPSTKKAPSKMMVKKNVKEGNTLDQFCGVRSTNGVLKNPKRSLDSNDADETLKKIESQNKMEKNAESVGERSHEHRKIKCLKLLDLKSDKNPNSLIMEPKSVIEKAKKLFENKNVFEKITNGLSEKKAEPANSIVLDKTLKDNPEKIYVDKLRDSSKSW